MVPCAQRHDVIPTSHRRDADAAGCPDMRPLTARQTQAAGAGLARPATLFSAVHSLRKGTNQRANFLYFTRFGMTESGPSRRILSSS